MTAGLSSPSGSNIDAVVASTLRFVLAVESVVCKWVMLFLSWIWSSFGFHNNPSVVIPSSLSSDNVCCVSCSSFGIIQGGSNMTGTVYICLHTNQSRSYLNHLVFKNFELLHAHFLNVSPAVCSKDDISCCTLIASSNVEVPLSKSSP